MADKKSKDIKGTASNLIKRQWQAVTDDDREKRLKLGKKIKEAIGPYEESGKIGERILQKEKLTKQIKERDAPEKWKHKRLKEVEKGTHGHLATHKAIAMAEADVERDLPTSPPKKQKEPEAIEIRKGGQVLEMKHGGLIKGFPKLTKKGWK
jgi:hypothetical protein